MNNYGEDDWLRLQEVGRNLCTYAVMGKEVGEQGTAHIQGFFNLSKKCKFSTAKRHVGETAHIEPAKGTDEQNREYCSKGSDVFEHGVPCYSGKRSDLAAVVNTISEGEWESVWLDMKGSPPGPPRGEVLSYSDLF